RPGPCRYAAFGRSWRTILGAGGPYASQNAAPTAHRHVLAQRDFRGHAKSQFDFGAFGQGSVGEEEDSARTEILGKADAFNRSAGLTERKRKEIREPLSDTAFNANWRSGHRNGTSFAEATKPQPLR